MPRHRTKSIDKLSTCPTGQCRIAKHRNGITRCEPCRATRAARRKAARSRKCEREARELERRAYIASHLPPGNVLPANNNNLAYLDSLRLTTRFARICDTLEAIGAHKLSVKNVTAAFLLLEAPTREDAIASIADNLNQTFDKAAQRVADLILTFPQLAEPSEWVETSLEAAKRILDAANNN
jgi:sugar phosphate isomerase/epimerase